ncbi:MAG: glycosyltransferase family 39 protein [Clostridiales bacterium]|jgi:hypothetical protein|nr:glycosyltransferase family 39 protein [Clostridiales bacterium]
MKALDVLEACIKFPERVFRRVILPAVRALDGLSIWQMYVFLIPFRIGLLLLTKPFIALENDTATYSTQFSGDIFHGIIDPIRTPLYPLFIKIFSFGGESYGSGFIWVMVWQNIISLISVWFMWKLLKRVTNSKRARAIGTLFYGASPMLIQANKYILTESLSISLSTILIYLLVRHIQKPRCRTAAVISVYAFLLIMLRPSFLTIFAVILAFWMLKLIIDRADWRASLTGLAAGGLCVALLFTYVQANSAQNDCNSLTYVEICANQTMNLMNARLVENPYYPEITEYIKAIPSYLDGSYYMAAWEPLEYFPASQIEAYVKSTIALHKTDYIKYIVGNLGKALLEPTAHFLPLDVSGTITEDMFEPYIPLLTFVFLSSFIPMGVTAFIALINMLVIIIKRIRKGPLDWIGLGLSVCVISHIITIAIGSPEDHARLFLPIVPFAIALYALVFTQDWCKKILRKAYLIK